MAEADKDYGAELKALAALHGEGVGRKCRVISEQWKSEEKTKRSELVEGFEEFLVVLFETLLGLVVQGEFIFD